MTVSQNPVSSSGDPSRALASFEIASVTLGYRALDLLLRDSSVEVLEASVIAGGRFWILAEGERGPLELFAGGLRSSLEGSGDGEISALIDQEILAPVSSGLLEALFSLAQTSLEQVLIVVECETVAGLIAALQTLSGNHHLKLIEAKIHRGARCGGYAFATGTLEDSKPAAEDVRTRLKARMRVGHVETIEATNAKFREHFNISGLA